MHGAACRRLWQTPHRARCAALPRGEVDWWEQPPFDNSAVRRAFLPGIRQSDYMPADLPSLNAFSEIAADMFCRVGIDLDYQASDWGTAAPRLSGKEGLDKGGWSVWCNSIPGIIAVTPATQSCIRGIGRAGTFGWPESARLEALRSQFLDADRGVQPAVRIPAHNLRDAQQLSRVLQHQEGLSRPEHRGLHRGPVLSAGAGLSGCSAARRRVASYACRRRSARRRSLRAR